MPFMGRGRGSSATGVGRGGLTRSASSSVGWSSMSPGSSPRGGGPKDGRHGQSRPSAAVAVVASSATLRPHGGLLQGSLASNPVRTHSPGLCRRDGLFVVGAASDWVVENKEVLLMTPHTHGRPYFTRWHRGGLYNLSGLQQPPRWFLKGREVSTSLGYAISRGGTNLYNSSARRPGR